MLKQPLSRKYTSADSIFLSSCWVIFMLFLSGTIRVSGRQQKSMQELPRMQRGHADTGNGFRDLSLCILGNILCFCCLLMTFQIFSFFFKKISGRLSECQAVWIQIGTHILLGLIWVQSVSKGYQQTTSRC